MNKSIIDRIKKVNYVTEYPTATSGYLSTDGMYIHLIAKSDEDRGGWYREDHRSIQHFMNRCPNDGPWDCMIRFMKHGNIRFSPEGHGFEFAKLPTREQIRAIIRYQKEFYNEDVCIERYDVKHNRTETIGNLQDFCEYCRSEGIIF